MEEHPHRHHHKGTAKLRNLDKEKRNKRGLRKKETGKIPSPWRVSKPGEAYANQETTPDPSKQKMHTEGA